MCDTLVLPGVELGAHGSIGTLFAKNSDREPDEAQQVVTLPAADHGAGREVACTYITIPQAAHTHAVLLSKPFWLWGAEMGANEHGVVIGNEAVFTQVPEEKQEKSNGLIGMDLLRLALERATSASEAIAVITDLLAKWGQAGNCGYRREFRYDNSFIIADAQEAWVLETAGRDWVAQRARGPRSISNVLTLGREWDKGSVAAGSDFAATYTDVERTRKASGPARCARTQALLDGTRSATPAQMMAHLRYHGADANTPGWHPALAPDRTVCMHVGTAREATSQTTGSMVSRLGKDGSIHFVTGVASPCSALFIPMWVDCALPAARMQPGGERDDATLFWQHERLLGAILAGYAERATWWEAVRAPLEERLIAQGMALQGQPCEVRENFVGEAIEQVYALYRDSADQLGKLP